MIDTINYKKIIITVNNEFKNQPFKVVTFDSVNPVSQNSMKKINQKIKKHTIIGILFCRPEVEFVQKEIITSLNYLHHRSAENINFFCCGYGTHSPSPSKVVATIDNIDWFFSDKNFVSLVEEFEDKTTWQYSGETDFLLLDVIPSSDEQELNINNAIVCNLEQMKKDNAFSSVRNFFEELIRYYTLPKNKSLLAYSDIQGINKGLDFLKNLVLKILPLGIGKLYRSAQSYAIRDISKK